MTAFLIFKKHFNRQRQKLTNDFYLSKNSLQTVVICSHKLNILKILNEFIIYFINRIEYFIINNISMLIK